MVIGCPMIKYHPARDNIRESCYLWEISSVTARKHYRPGVGVFFTETRRQTPGTEGLCLFPLPESSSFNIYGTMMAATDAGGEEAEIDEDAADTTSSRLAFLTRTEYCMI
jgi:hypothetical protein